MRLMDWRRRWVGRYASSLVLGLWERGFGKCGLEEKGGREGFGREENLVGGGCGVWGGGGFGVGILTCGDQRRRGLDGVGGGLRTKGKGMRADGRRVGEEGG